MKLHTYIVVGTAGLASAAPSNNFFIRAFLGLRATSNSGDSGAPLGSSTNPGTLAQNRAAIPNLTADQKARVQAAIQQWSVDTSLVSCTLNMLGGNTLNATDFSDAADAGYDAEIDEVIQKATIDALIGTMPLIQSANANLTNGTFISVVDGLRELRIRGPTSASKAIVDLMNNNRCRPIMEAIDAYLLAGAMAIGNNTPPTAVRPQACLAVVAQTGSVLPLQRVNNCTSYPRANELVRDYGQSPTFQLSNSVAQGGQQASGMVGALGDTFPNQSNQSSALGQQPGLFPKGNNINGPVSNGIANPVNVDFGLAQPGNGNSPKGKNADTTGGTTSTGGNSGGNRVVKLVNTVEQNIDASQQ